MYFNKINIELLKLSRKFEIQKKHFKGTQTFDETAGVNSAQLFQKITGILRHIVLVV